MKGHPVHFQKSKDTAGRQKGNGRCEEKSKTQKFIEHGREQTAHQKNQKLADRKGSENFIFNLDKLGNNELIRHMVLSLSYQNRSEALRDARQRTSAGVGMSGTSNFSAAFSKETPSDSERSTTRR